MFRRLFSQNRYSLLYLLLIVLLPLVFTSSVTFFLLNNEQDVYTFTALEWIGFYSVTVLTMAFALTPTTFIALVSGYFLGMVSVLYVLPSYFTASILGFLLASFVDRGKLIKSVSENPKVQQFLINLRHSQVTFIILSRISPVLPFALMNFVLAAMKVRFKNFLLAGFIGMLPRTLLFIWVGKKARDLKQIIENPTGNHEVKIIVGIMLIVSIVGFFYIILNAVRKAATNVKNEQPHY